MSATQIHVLDTTLRDGQQSPGAGMSLTDNILYAEIGHKLKLDILEAGFPSASSTDFEIVNIISTKMTELNSTMKISALSQLREDQVIKTIEALQPSCKIGRGRIHIYVPVDPDLMHASLGKLADDKPLIINTLHRLIKLIHDNGYEVQFSPEGYSRQRDNFDFVTDLIRSAVSGGATVINCPDTIGGASRFEGENYFVNKIKRHSQILKQEFPDKNLIWSAHCHNDFGIALDNTLDAVFSGAVTQVEGCINGVGERSGNMALEQFIMNVRQFGMSSQLEHKVYTNIDILHLKEASDFIANKMLPRQPHSPIVGKNSASHTSGGHINAILKNPLAYQPFDPKDIGSEISFVFGPLSGSNHAKQVIEKFGYICAETDKVKVTQAIKDYYHDRRKGITDDELLVAYKIHRSPIKLNKLDYAKTSDNKTILTIFGSFFDKENLSIEYQGKGSALSALNNAVSKYFPNVVVEDYSSKSQGHTVDALCISTIIVSVDGKERYTGSAMDDDIEVSAIKAFIDAVNTAYIEINFKTN